MANWSLPTTTDTYTNFLQYLKDRDLDLAKQFDGVTITNPVSGMIRWNSTSNYWEKYSGVAWAALTTKYMIDADKVDGCNVDDTSAASTTTLWTSSKINTFANNYYTKTEIDTIRANYILKNGNTGTLTIGTNDASAFNLETNNTSRLSIGSSGNITVSTPASGIALTVNNASGQNSITATGTIEAPTLKSTVATGTAPLTVTSTTVVPNLNADMVDGKHIGTSGNTIPLLDGANTFSNVQTVPNINIDNGGVDGGNITFKSQGNTALAIDNLSGTLRVFDSVELFKINSTTGNVWCKGAASLDGGISYTPSIELGSQDTVASTPYIDFHSGTTATDYDSRIIASGGTATVGQGILEVQSNSFRVPSILGVGVSATKPAALAAFIAIGDADTGIGQSSDGKFEVWSNNQKILGISTVSTAGGFDNSGTVPSGTIRLNYSGYFYPTYLNLAGSSDTTTTATHYYVETGTDGFVRPKPLANVRTEIVTKAAVEASGAELGAKNGVFYENNTAITTSYTITSGKNAMTAGPVTINDGVVITIPNGSTWTVV